jgi:low temperature requirement protein LtrA
MAHEAHQHEEKKPLSLFASPLLEPTAHANHSDYHAPSVDSSDLEAHKPVDTSGLAHADTSYTTHVPFANNTDYELQTPAFHRHAEATTAELFYDLFFVANLTTFTSVLEINDRNSLTAYIGFFALLWLTWYQVSLYDIRFSSDSVFERVAKAIHFGVMVGFAVIGPQWKPGQEINEYKIYKAFGLILMVSRITLFLQYAVTLFYTRKYRKTIIPLGLIMASTLIAAILYGALTPAFPAESYVPQKSNVYIAWYVIGISETLLTVGVSCISHFRAINFKGTHMVQRMSLLTLIILGEGIIVICKSISKIVKNEFLWTAAVVGQIIAAVLIIYFLYMLYFDRMQEEHFGSIKQQVWSILHFPLHTVLVLVLQGVSLLVVWTQLVQALYTMDASFTHVAGLNFTDGAEFADHLNLTAYQNVFYYVPKGVDASKEIMIADYALYSLSEGYDYLLADPNNATAAEELTTGLENLVAAATKTLFDSFSVTIPKTKMKKGSSLGFEDLLTEYVGVFELVFVYVFIAVRQSSILLLLLFLSLSLSPLLPYLSPIPLKPITNADSHSLGRPLPHSHHHSRRPLAARLPTPRILLHPTGHQPRLRRRIVLTLDDTI